MSGSDVLAMLILEMLALLCASFPINASIRPASSNALSEVLRAVLCVPDAVGFTAMSLARYTRRRRQSRGKHSAFAQRMALTRRGSR